jgi:hypothetical protein
MFGFRQVSDRNPRLVGERFLRFVPIDPEVSDRFFERGAAVASSSWTGELKVFWPMEVASSSSMTVPPKETGTLRGS